MRRACCFWKALHPREPYTHTVSHFEGHLRVLPIIIYLFCTPICLLNCIGTTPRAGPARTLLSVWQRKCFLGGLATWAMAPWRTPWESLNLAMSLLCPASRSQFRLTAGLVEVSDTNRLCQELLFSHSSWSEV